MELFLIFAIFELGSAQTFFDAYDGHRLSNQELLQHEAANTTYWCLNSVKLPCDPNEYRRVDGSCNNLNQPTKGMGKQRFARILPSIFGPGWYQPRLAKSGKNLPLGRRLRTGLLPEGKVPDAHFNHNVANFLVLMVTDIASVHDSVNYVIWKTKCCTPEDKDDPIYAPNYIPDDDPVFRHNGLKCMNMTRPMTFQTQKCTTNDSSPERVNTATPVFDMSMIYGSTINSNQESARSFKSGLLLTETDEFGRVWPPTSEELSFCVQNNRPNEKKCFVTPDPVMNSIAGLSVMGVWFWRQHNGIARELSIQNPHWNDEKLYEAARDINLAIYLQMYLYELLPLLAGYDNMVKSGAIADNSGFRDAYNEEMYPQIFIEFTSSMRWVHTLQEGMIKLYDSTGKEYDEMPLVNLTLRPAYMMKEGNIEGMTQGCIRQSGGSSDYVVDPDIVNLGLGALQQALDLCTNDLMKHRYFGIQPYVKYLEHFRGKSYKTFEDLSDVIDEERIEALKENYDDIEDIDLLAGLWVEKHVEGGILPVTFFDIIATQLKMSLMSDRYWYESSRRPNAFTDNQLLEIRKATLALMMCKYADSVTEVQAQAFLKISAENPLTCCDEIVQMDFSAWKEEYICKHNLY